LSAKFEGEMLDEIRSLKARILALERTVDELTIIKKPPVIDEVNEWLKKRYNGKNGRI
jgi:hypothetical protein